ncbi:YihY/virulence factor BrkB family protein [Paenirhodobacter sp. CAU 1674]|uniref:YihY/virulence factor BrkB family protein n=1 Tax=Paenirhodobacter sp. CAU 1674 TaxID=3032596 RepID=UPI0023DA2C76|nr:YihY/virulence factor BrkB family protein [Paenirhodobacter sp. CAU 1674]MDF2141926.1 YihY/virulence factor BrkB family protein [Paenirhodobacter sp. CAU 1674]
MKHIAKFGLRFLGRLARTNISLIAAGVAFYAMLAVFPGLSALIAIWSAFADPAVIGSYLAVADDFIPPEAFAILTEQILLLLQGPRTTIGWGTVLSVAVALFSARAGVGALVLGLDVIHGTRPRNTLLSFLFGYVMTLALVAVMLLAMATVVVVPIAVNFLPFHALTGWLLSGLPWGGMLLLMLSALGILYRYGPNTRGARDPILTLGAVLATLVWGIASLALTYYLTNFGSYNKVYGSIGAVIALLMWLYLSAFSVLLGAALNAELAASRRPPVQK